MLRAVKTTPLIWRLIIMALVAGSGLAVSSPEVALRMKVPLFSPPGHQLKGPGANSESAFLLPHHVELMPGAELRLRLTGSPLLKSGSIVTIELNDRTVTAFPWENPPPGQAQEVALPLIEGVLQPGWNRVRARAALVSSLEEPSGSDNPAAWLQFENGTCIEVPWARGEEFPELARFPATLVEEHLLRQDAPEGETLTILLPEHPDQSELRTLLIACARLGQSSWIRAGNIRIGSLADWPELKSHGFGLLIGRSGELRGLGLPKITGDALKRLQEGEGLLADLAGEDSCSRWILASGADPAGMDKAAQALGSSRSIKNAPSNQWIVQNNPGDPVADAATASSQAARAGGSIGLNDLSDLRAIGARDALLKKSVVLVPEENTPARQEILKILGLEWGRRWSESPMLWPELATYGNGNPPALERVKDRSGYVFGSASQWVDAFEKDGLLAIDADSQGQLRLRNERMVGSTTDAEWCFVQWVPSPWTAGEAFAVFGGARDFGGDALVRALTMPETIDRVAGSVAAVDVDGRVVCYDTRTAQPFSLSEKLAHERQQAPGAIETERARIGEAEIQAGVVDTSLLIAGALVLGGLFAWQRWAVQRRKQREVLK